MSILIKGMVMPKPKFADMATVYDAYVLISPNGHAAIVVDNEDGLDSTEYPLVPVPPHGRLIDADALKDIEFHGLQADKKISYQMGWNDAIATIAENATTIIPAEEGET